MATKKTLPEIEVALAHDDKFNFVRNVISFNVNGWGGNLPLFHEADMIVLSKSGYLTEVEIKRSFADFKNDFKKDHQHANSKLVKNFYYCVPIDIVEKCIAYFEENGRFEATGFCAYCDEDNLIRFYNVNNTGKEKREFRKLTPDEMFQVARYGAMRNVTLKKKTIKLLIENARLKNESYYDEVVKLRRENEKLLDKINLM